MSNHLVVGSKEKIYKQMKDKSSSADEYYKKIAKQTESLTEVEFLSLFDKNSPCVSVMTNIDNNLADGCSRQ